MKLVHDIENDLEHTIPTDTGVDSRWLFREMTARSLALLAPAPGMRVLDLGSGMGQDTLAVAQAVHGNGAAAPTAGGPGLVVGLEPSDRMIRFGQWQQRSRDDGPPARWSRALAEELPFAAGSFDAVLCKGAMDHFLSPARTMREVARVLRPGGRVVLALANYDALSCRLGRWMDAARRVVRPGTALPPQPYYEPPPDHLTRFGHAGIVGLVVPPLRLRRVEGVSLLWGFPPWRALLQRLPVAWGERALAGAFALARRWPAEADVVLVDAEKRA